jgi:hypothetical protein
VESLGASIQATQRNRRQAYHGTTCLVAPPDIGTLVHALDIGFANAIVRARLLSNLSVDSFLPVIRIELQSLSMSSSRHNRI